MGQPLSTNVLVDTRKAVQTAAGHPSFSERQIAKSIRNLPKLLEMHGAGWEMALEG